MQVLPEGVTTRHTERGTRFVLPPRAGGRDLAVRRGIGVVLFLAAALCVIMALSGGADLLALVGVACGILALIVLAGAVGRAEFELRDGVVLAKSGTGLPGSTRQWERADSAGVHLVRTRAKLGRWPTALTLSGDAGRSFVVASGYPPDVLQPLGALLARELDVPLHDETRIELKPVAEPAALEEQVAAEPAAEAEEIEQPPHPTVPQWPARRARSSRSAQPAPDDDRQRPVRLEPNSGLGALGCVGVFAVFWLAGTLAASGAALDGGVLPVLISTVFWLAFLAMAAFVVHGVLARARLPLPAVELSVHPLRLGESFSGQLTQGVRTSADLACLTIRLLCRESATYKQGTSSTTVTKVVVSRKLVIPVDAVVPAGSAVGGALSFSIPAEAMTSFDAHRNKVEWLLEVHAEVRRWPDLTCKFPLRVEARRATPRSEAVTAAPVHARTQEFSLELESGVALCGGMLTGRVRVPRQGSRKPGAIVVEAGWRTEGRGDRDTQTVVTKTLPVPPEAAGGEGVAAFELEIPADAPPSYDGHYVRVVWEVVARLDVDWAIDPKVRCEVTIEVP